jgi:hypothetical protein
MNALNLGSDEMPEKKKKSNTRNLKIALGLAAVILVPTIGSTLAGTITIGSGPVEFGQGLAVTAACGNITLVPSATFDNDTGDTGIFKLGTVTLTIPSACSTKTFTIKAWNTTNDTAVSLTTRTGTNTTGAIIIVPTITADSCSTTIPSTPATANETVTACTAASSVATVPITLAGTLASAQNIYKFTVETA